jgi:hypothetical protein
MPTLTALHLQLDSKTLTFTVKDHGYYSDQHPTAYASIVTIYKRIVKTGEHHA